MYILLLTILYASYAHGMIQPTNSLSTNALVPAIMHIGDDVLLQKEDEASKKVSQKVSREEYNGMLTRANKGDIEASLCLSKYCKQGVEGVERDLSTKSAYYKIQAFDHISKKLPDYQRLQYYYDFLTKKNPKNRLYKKANDSLSTYEFSDNSAISLVQEAKNGDVKAQYLLGMTNIKSLFFAAGVQPDYTIDDQIKWLQEFSPISERSQKRLQELQKNRDLLESLVKKDIHQLTSKEKLSLAEHCFFNKDYKQAEELFYELFNIPETKSYSNFYLGYINLEGLVDHQSFTNAFSYMKKLIDSPEVNAKKSGEVLAERIIAKNNMFISLEIARYYVESNQIDNAVNVVSHIYSSLEQQTKQFEESQKQVRQLQQMRQLEQLPQAIIEMKKYSNLSNNFQSAEEIFNELLTKEVTPLQQQRLADIAHTRCKSLTAEDETDKYQKKIKQLNYIVNYLTNLKDSNEKTQASLIKAYKRLGIIYLKLDNYTESINNFSHILKLAPQYTKAYSLITGVNIKAKRKKPLSKLIYAADTLKDPLSMLNLGGILLGRNLCLQESKYKLAETISGDKLENINQGISYLTNVTKLDSSILKDYKTKAYDCLCEHYISHYIPEQKCVPEQKCEGMLKFAQEAITHGISYGITLYSMLLHLKKDYQGALEILKKHEKEMMAPYRLPVLIDIELTKIKSVEDALHNSMKLIEYFVEHPAKGIVNGIKLYRICDNLKKINCDIHSDTYQKINTILGWFNFLDVYYRLDMKVFLTEREMDKNCEWLRDTSKLPEIVSLTMYQTAYALKSANLDKINIPDTMSRIYNGFDLLKDQLADNPLVKQSYRETVDVLKKRFPKYHADFCQKYQKYYNLAKIA